MVRLSHGITNINSVAKRGRHLNWRGMGFHFVRWRGCYCYAAVGIAGAQG